MTISATDEGRRANKTEAIAVGEMERLLDAIDPWLTRHYDRLVMDYAKSR